MFKMCQMSDGEKTSDIGSLKNKSKLVDWFASSDKCRTKIILEM